MSHRGPHDPRQRLNDHHADDLLAIAIALGGHPDARSASVARIDGDGIDLDVETPGGPATARVPFAGTGDARRPSTRMAFRALARRARADLAAGTGRPARS